MSRIHSLFKEDKKKCKVNYLIIADKADSKSVNLIYKNQVFNCCRTDTKSIQMLLPILDALQEHALDGRRRVGIGDIVDGGNGLRDEDVGNAASANAAVFVAQPHGGG